MPSRTGGVAKHLGHAWYIETALLSYLILICVVSTYNDSKTHLHKLSHIWKNFQCKRLLGFLVGSKNFSKLLWVSWEVFVLQGYDWIHWVAKSCTTTANRTLFLDSQPSLGTLWSAVVKSPKCSALGTTVPVRLLQEAQGFGVQADIAMSVVRWSE